MCDLFFISKITPLYDIGCKFTLLCYRSQGEVNIIWQIKCAHYYVEIKAIQIRVHCRFVLCKNTITLMFMEPLGGEPKSNSINKCMRNDEFLRCICHSTTKQSLLAPSASHSNASLIYILNGGNITPAHLSSRFNHFNYLVRAHHERPRTYHRDRGRRLHSMMHTYDLAWCSQILAYTSCTTVWSKSVWN